MDDRGDHDGDVPRRESLRSMADRVRGGRPVLRRLYAGACRAWSALRAEIAGLRLCVFHVGLQHGRRLGTPVGRGTDGSVRSGGFASESGGSGSDPFDLRDDGASGAHFPTNGMRTGGIIAESAAQGAVVIGGTTAWGSYP